MVNKHDIPAAKVFVDSVHDINPNTYDNIKFVLDKITELRDEVMTDENLREAKLEFLCSDGAILQEAQAKIAWIVTVVAFGHVDFKGPP